jgi:hypothetical protein
MVFLSRILIVIGTLALLVSIIFKIFSLTVSPGIVAVSLFRLSVALLLLAIALLVLVMAEKGEGK